MDCSKENRAQVDLELTQRFLAGSEQAISDLGSRLGCIPRMLRTINRRRGAPLGEHDLEDLSQVIVVTVLDKLPSFRAIVGIEAWVYRIAHFHYLNAVRNDWRRAKREAELQLLSYADEGQGSRFTSTDSNAQDVEMLDDLLDELEENMAEAIRMKHYDELSFTEIGKELSTSPNTIKARYYRGIEMLQTKLNARLPAGDKR